MRTFLIAIMGLIASYAVATADVMRVVSAHDVKTTVDRLEAAVNGGGATVFARIDHQANAAGIGMEMHASSVLIFGNPKGGTPLMKAAAGIGLDLPLRVHVYDDGGTVVLEYHDPVGVAEAYGIPADHKAVLGAAGALKKLTAKAAASE